VPIPYPKHLNVCAVGYPYFLYLFKPPLYRVYHVHPSFRESTRTATFFSGVFLFIEIKKSAQTDPRFLLFEDTHRDEETLKKNDGREDERTLLGPRIYGRRGRRSRDDDAIGRIAGADHREEMLEVRRVRYGRGIYAVL
jgi:hypothetical protein